MPLGLPWMNYAEIRRLYIFIILKLVDFNNLGVLDFILFILLGVDIVITLLTWRK